MDRFPNLTDILHPPSGMTEIVFKGKEYVYNHHLTVPYRPLEPQAGKGIGASDLNGNLVIHGDNLLALKSLLPRHAGQVDLIFADTSFKQALLARLTQAIKDERFVRAGELELEGKDRIDVVCDLVFEADWRGTLEHRYFAA